MRCLCVEHHLAFFHILRRYEVNVLLHTFVALPFPNQVLRKNIITLHNLQRIAIFNQVNDLLGIGLRLIPEVASQLLLSISWTQVHYLLIGLSFVYLAR